MLSSVPESVLEKRYRKRAQRLHLARLRQIHRDKSTRINNSEPYHRQFTHVSKSDRLRHAEIKLANKTLADKITHATASPTVARAVHTPVNHLSLNHGQKQRETAQVLFENRRLSRRISEVSPTLQRVLKLNQPEYQHLLQYVYNLNEVSLQIYS